MVLKTLILVFIVYLSSFLLLKLGGRKGIQWLAFMVGGIGIVFQLLVNRQEKFGVLGFGFASITDYLFVITAIAAILLLGFIAGHMAGKLKTGFDWDLKTGLRALRQVIVRTVQGGVIAIFTEELVFRGLVQRQLALSLPSVWAILIASLLFGIWHMPVGALILGFNRRQLILYGLGTGLVGAVFGIFYAQSGSLIVAGFAHGFWNAIVYFFWGLGSMMKTALETSDDALTHPEYGVIGVGLLAVAIPILLVIF